MIGKIVFLFFLVSFTSNLFSTEVPLKKGAQVVVKTKSGFFKGKIKSHSNFRESYKVLLSSGKSIRKPYDEVFRVVNPRAKDLQIKNYILYQPSSEEGFFKASIMKNLGGDQYEVQLHGQNAIKGRKKTNKNNLVAYVSENLRLGGEYCKRVNLLRHKWVKSWKMPQYNQGFTGLCYAYTGIQMFDYWRQTKGLRISKDVLLSDAIYAGLLTRLKFNTTSPDFEGGFTSQVLYGIKMKGMCRSDVIQKSLKQFAVKNKIDTREFYEAVLNYVTRKRSWKNFDGFWDAFQEKIVNAARGGVIKLFKRRKVYSKTKFKLVYEKLKPYIDKDNLTGFYRDVFKDCSKPGNYYLNSKKIPLVQEISIDGHYEESQKKKFYLQIHTLLEKKQIIGIEYCAQVLTFKNANLFYKNRRIKNKCYRHASLIVGRRVQEGKCQLLLRNSWGTNCRYPWKCLKNKKGEEMGIWVDEESMKKNLYNLTYFSEK